MKNNFLRKLKFLLLCKCKRKTKSTAVCQPISLCSSLMQIVLEASVGNIGMSDIAVDDVTFAQGPCPGMLIVRYLNSSVRFKPKPP